jgi:hypothetical protein
MAAKAMYKTPGARFPGQPAVCHMALEAPAVHSCISAMGGKFKTPECQGLSLNE